MALERVEDGDRIDEGIFVNEDLKRPENRINAAMFEVMVQRWFRTWLLWQLGIAGNAIIYPPTNSETMRPNFTIEDRDTRETLGWIEVEIGRDPGQLSRYQDHFAEPVKSILGHGGDVSLVCIACRLECELDAETLEPQARLSVLLLRKLIANALSEAASDSKPVRVSSKMKGHWLIQALTNMRIASTGCATNSAFKRRLGPRRPAPAEVERKFRFSGTTLCTRHCTWANRWVSPGTGPRPART